MVAPLKKAVFPVAGLGTRFLPATKDVPKEMMPLIDKPIIHHGVEEAVASGCTDITFITSPGKESIKNYFSKSDELVNTLSERGKRQLAEKIDAIHKMASFSYGLQARPLGLGHAVLCAKELCGEEPFALLLPDDVMVARPTVISQLDAVRHKYGGSVICAMQVPDSEVSRYGIIDGDEVEPGIFRVRALVEKPNYENAPSNLAIMGRYILSPAIFSHLEKIKRGSGGEYQLTDALNSLALDEPVYAACCEFRRLDCGVTEGWLEANIVKALEDDKLRNVVLNAVMDYKRHHS